MTLLKKMSAYGKSKYKSVKEVLSEMNDGKWTLKQAQKRRKVLSEMIKDYALGK